MSRLNKANNDGSISVIIPKRLIRILGWTTKDDITITLNKDQTKVVIQKTELEDV